MGWREMGPPPSPPAHPLLLREEFTTGAVRLAGGFLDQLAELGLGLERNDTSALEVEVHAAHERR